MQDTSAEIMFLKNVFVSFLLVFFSTEEVCDAASTTAFALQRVTTAISIQKLTDLNFGEAPQGDPKKEIPPGNAPNGENASFEVSGEGNRSYMIVLPSNNQIKMTLAHDESLFPVKEISVDDFRSNPSEQGSLGSMGKQTLYVGATRAPLATNQAPGSYRGAFVVTVVY